MKKKTAGEIQIELAEKKYEDKRSATDEMQIHLTDFEKKLFDFIQENKDGPRFIGIDPLYIEVSIRKHRLLPDLPPETPMMMRVTCPTPNYDQSVYRYWRTSSDVEHLWVIPDRITTHIMYYDPIAVPLDQRQLLQFVLDFADGSLFQMAKKLNGETADSILLQE